VGRRGRRIRTLLKVRRSGRGRFPAPVTGFGMGSGAGVLAAVPGVKAGAIRRVIRGG
jgi:hypothetical protein